jgi:site-specific DNA-cytosine methylase
VPVLLGRRKEAWPRRSRGQLFVRFIDLMAAIRPRYAVIENVRGVLSKKLGSLPVILAKIEQAGYQVSYKLYGAGDFGVPQHRRRVVFFLSRDGARRFRRWFPAMVVKVNHVIARCGMLLAISRVQLWRCSILRHRFSSTCNTFRRAGTGDQSRWSISLLGFPKKRRSAPTGSPAQLGMNRRQPSSVR